MHDDFQLLVVDRIVLGDFRCAGENGGQETEVEAPFLCGSRHSNGGGRRMGTNHHSLHIRRGTLQNSGRIGLHQIVPRWEAV